MIIFTKDPDCDWPEYWELWIQNGIDNNYGDEEDLKAIAQSANYNVCYNCGQEYAIVWESGDSEEQEFRCVDCNKIVNPENYTNRYIDMNISYAEEIEV